MHTDGGTITDQKENTQVEDEGYWQWPKCCLCVVEQWGGKKGKKKKKKKRYDTRRQMGIKQGGGEGRARNWYFRKRGV